MDDSYINMSWNHLPSVVLLEVFSYLSHNEKIRASSTCKYWRSTLYHPSYWENVHFITKTNDPDSISRTRYLTSCFARKLRNATVTFDSLDPQCVQQVARILENLCDNCQLRSLILQPSHCRFAYPDRGNEGQIYFERYLLQPLQLLVQRCRRLEVLNLGCSDKLTTYAKPVLDMLSKHQSCSLRHLGLASVKENPDDYLLLDLDSIFFQSFLGLQVLSIDYDYVSDSLLTVLGNMELLRLIIHVHGIEDSHPGTSNSAWTSFTHQNPSCELRLNLIHSYDSLVVLHSHVLKPRMPLTHLRIFFCEGMNIAALHLLSSCYSDCLRSLWLIDSLDGYESPHLGDDGNVLEPTDPLIMASWICSKLEEIVLLGYKYYAADLIAIARLRGAGLKRLDIYSKDIADVECLEELEQEMSDTMGMNWMALTDSQLHEAIINPTGSNSDEFILAITRHDHHVHL